MQHVEKGAFLARIPHDLTLDLPGKFVPHHQPGITRPRRSFILKSLITRLREWRRERRKVKKFVEGFTPINEYMPEDVFIVGYPKSGNTWFQDLITATVYGVYPAYAPPSLAHTLVPDVHGKPFYKRISKTMYFKSHHLPRPEYRRVVYLVRDGRDAMVSFYHYNMAMNGAADLMEMVQTGKDVLQGKWHDHVNAWLANPFRAEMIIIKYEDLKQDPFKELQRFCEFAGVERAEAFLKQIAEETAFEKMQKKEIESGAGHPGWPGDKLFRRRGKIGSFKDEMSPPVLEAFMAQAGSTLFKCGYI